jgi:hypothetical protein
MRRAGVNIMERINPDIMYIKKFSRRFANFLTIAAIGFSASIATAWSITVSIDTKNPGQEIPGDYLGLSFEGSLLLPDTNGVRYFRPDNQPLVDLFHTLGIRHLRIGGNTSDRAAVKLPEPADIDALFGFAKAANVKVIYCLRLYNGDPQEAATTAKYIMDRYAPLMDCFSIGQEPSAYPNEKKDTRAQTEQMGAENEKHPYGPYRDSWKRFADAIVTAVPEAKFCGPGVHNNGKWGTNFINDFGKSNHVVLITEHLYPGGAGGKVPSPEAGIDRMLGTGTNVFSQACQKLYDGFAPVAISNGLPYRLEEVNNYFNGGATNVSNTFAAALWGLSFMYWWADHGAAGINFHTGDQVAAGAKLLPSKYTAFVSSANGYYVRPLGYGLKAFDLGSHGKLLKVTGTKGSIEAYAVLGDDKNIYVTLINLARGAEAKPEKVTFGLNNPEYKSGDVIRLAAPDNDVTAMSGETLGGSAISDAGAWTGSWKPLKATDGESSLSVELPPASAAIVRLGR